MTEISLQSDAAVRVWILTGQEVEPDEAAVTTIELVT